MDGNFKAKHMHDRRPADQVWLMDGHGFMVTDPDYWTYLKATPHITEKSACNNHKAINQANAQWGRLHSTGIGAGWVDGEIIETLWLLLNIASTLAQGMSSPHCQELLDFQISNCNFMKMIHMVDSLIWKLTTTRVAVDMAKQAFKTLDEAVSTTQRDTWTYQEQVAFRDRMVDPSAVDIFEVQMRKAPTVHTIELEFLNNITSSGVQHGMGSWLARGLRLEEAAITLCIDYRNVGVHVPELKRLVIARRTERLLSEQSGFIADAAIYIGLQQDAGGDWNPINAEGSEQWDGRCMSDGYLLDAEDPNDGSDKMLTADTTDLGGIATLLLPSNVGMTAFHSCNSGHLCDMELRLQIGQANDVLNGLWLALVDKAVVFWNVV
ncbi:hypothetical protein M404DRAFT_18069 [Pisolithus tinctorius Marx 270]|uniref:Uncharacterized protein n=1 Tax=Pisolithus tinctorius Marx 270 TaxID=870435 RepID=A0A0C3PI85_PISTI|nr:hypothetical protein M404DRAFT_18069 [Pisolithus tinctorius Marx 270]